MSEDYSLCYYWRHKLHSILVVYIAVQFIWIAWRLLLAHSLLLLSSAKTVIPQFLCVAHLLPSLPQTMRHFSMLTSQVTTLLSISFVKCVKLPSQKMALAHIVTSQFSHSFISLATVLVHISITSQTEKDLPPCVKSQDHGQHQQNEWKIHMLSSMLTLVKHNLHRLFLELTITGRFYGVLYQSPLQDYCRSLS